MVALGNCSLAVFLCLFAATCVAEKEVAQSLCAERDDAALSLLQTGSFMQRASVPSEFFELEDLSSSPAAAARTDEVQAAAAAARHTPLPRPPIALFDVGSNSVPAPLASDFVFGSKTISLAEVGAPLASSADPQQVGDPLLAPSAHTPALKEQILSGLHRLKHKDEEEEEEAGQRPRTRRRKAAGQRSSEISEEPANLRHLLSLASLVEQSRASSAPEMEVLETEPPLAAANEASASESQLDREDVTQLMQGKQEVSEDFYVDEAPDAPAKFMQQQADAAGEESGDQNDIVSASGDQSKAEAVGQSRAATATISTEADSEGQMANTEDFAKDVRATVLPDLRELDIADPEVDDLGSTEYRDSPHLRMHRYDTSDVSQSLDRRHDNSPHPRMETQDITEVNQGLDETMSLLEDDEQKLLAGLEARRERRGSSPYSRRGRVPQ